MTRAELMASPFKPSKKDIHSVLNSVFYKTSADDITLIEATLILAYKILRDTGHDIEQLLAILRFFKESIEEWSWGDRDTSLTLTINNNRYAAIVGWEYDQRLYNFRALKQVQPTAEPLVLQVSVVLSGLYVLAGGTLRRPSRSPSEEEDGESARSE